MKDIMFYLAAFLFWINCVGIVVLAGLVVVGIGKLIKEII